MIRQWSAVSGQGSVVGAHSRAPACTADDSRALDTSRPPRWLIWTKNIGVWLVVGGLVGLGQAMIFMSKDLSAAPAIPDALYWLLLGLLLCAPLGVLLIMISAYPGSQAWRSSWIRKPGIHAKICYVLGWLGVLTVLAWPLLTLHPVLLGMVESAGQVVMTAVLVGVLAAYLYVLLAVAYELLFPAEEDVRRIAEQGAVNVPWVLIAALLLLGFSVITLLLIEGYYQVHSPVLRALAWGTAGAGFAVIAVLHSPFFRQLVPNLERLRVLVGYKVLYPLVLLWLILNGCYVAYGGESLSLAVVLALGLTLAAGIGLHIEYAVRSRVGARLASPAAGTGGMNAAPTQDMTGGGVP